MARNPMAWKGKGKFYGKKETTWGWDGALNRTPHYLAHATFTDDFGNRVSVRRCKHCRRWLAQAEEFFQVRTRHETGHPKSWDPRCRECRNAKRRADWRATPPEQRHAFLHDRWERIKSDAEMLAERRAKNAEMQRRWRQQNPEASRAVTRRYRAKLKRDPKRWAEEVDKRRMRDRLRAEQQGKPRRPAKHDPSDHMPFLPVGPLPDFVLRHVRHDDDLEVACKRLGFDVRTLNEWRAGVRRVARFGVVDRILVATGMNWWDIYEKPANGHESGRPEDVLRYIAEAEVYVQACLAFEGELVE